MNIQIIPQGKGRLTDGIQGIERMNTSDFVEFALLKYLEQHSILK